MPTTTPVVPAGKVLLIDETDHMYGGGQLRIRTDRELELLHGMEWAEVTGVRMWENGREVEPLTVLVRVAAILGQIP